MDLDTTPVDVTTSGSNVKYVLYIANYNRDIQKCALIVY